jgi:hypothetical protein
VSVNGRVYLDVEMHAMLSLRRPDPHHFETMLSAGPNYGLNVLPVQVRVDEAVLVNLQQIFLRLTCASVSSLHNVTPWTADELPSIPYRGIACF